jgi:hypothetical protein
MIRCRVTARMAIAAALGLVGPAAHAQAAGPKPVQAILQSYVEDFRKDPAAERTRLTFGVRVRGEGGGDWHVVVEKKENGKETEVTLKRSLPETPGPYFTMDVETLQKLDRGEMSALTGLAQARSSDPTPVGLEFMPGYTPAPDFFATFVPLTFHFWTRGTPEIVAFGKQYSRVTHGANMVILYYQKGLRFAWGQVEKGQHVNKGERDQSNPFPSMFLAIRGRLLAKIGGKEIEMHAGQMLFVPPGVSHEFWNPYDEPCEVVLVMFGEGA